MVGMRRLIIVKTVHALADMGTMAAGIRRDSIKRFGIERWLSNKAMIDRFWEETEIRVKKLELDYSKTRVYQDGLPFGGSTALDIIIKAAEKGNKNYIIIRDLMLKGATVEATESPRLLMAEYRYLKATIKAKSLEMRKKASVAYDKMKSNLLQARDRHIAKAIDDSLKDGETGILFIGAAHDIASRLPGDIEVTTLS